MSYGFVIKKVNGTLVLANPEHLEQVAAQVPDGAVFAVSGHEPREGYSPVATIGVTLSIARDDQPGEQHRASASASYYAPPPVTIELADAAEPETVPAEG